MSEVNRGKITGWALVWRSLEWKLWCLCHLKTLASTLTEKKLQKRNYMCLQNAFFKAMHFNSLTWEKFMSCSSELHSVDVMNWILTHVSKIFENRTIFNNTQNEPPGTHQPMERVTGPSHKTFKIVKTSKKIFGKKRNQTNCIHHITWPQPEWLCLKHWLAF